MKDLVSLSAISEGKHDGFADKDMGSVDRCMPLDAYINI